MTATATASRKTTAFPTRPTTYGSSRARAPTPAASGWRRCEQPKKLPKLGDTKSATAYHDLFAKAQASYIKKLWNGEYFRYDTLSEYKDNVQADQLAGQWYADMTGLGDIVPREMRQKALKKIYDYNVMKFAKGEMGAVNGMAADGTIIKTNEQVQEVWTGTTFGVAALMLSEGMKDEGYRTAWGIYHTTYETQGYWFRTPEAWEIDGNYRASHVHAPGSHLGHGNDSATKIVKLPRMT